MCLFFKAVSDIIHCLSYDTDYRKMQCRDNEIFYRQVQGRRDVVYIHGFTCNHSFFTHQFRFLEGQGYGTLAPDLLGFGRSSKPHTRKEYSLENYVEDIDTIIADSCQDKVVMVGHSMGSMLAQEYAARHPERLDSLVLISGTTDMKRHLRLPLCSSTFREMTLHYTRFLNLFNLRLSSGDIDYSHQAFSDIPDTGYLARIWSMLSKDAIEACCLVSEQLLSWDTSDSAGKIDAPTLIIHGNNDQLVKPQASYELAKLIRNSLGPVIVNGADHGICFKKPDEVNEVLDMFLRLY